MHAAAIEQSRCQSPTVHELVGGLRGLAVLFHQVIGVAVAVAAAGARRDVRCGGLGEGAGGGAAGGEGGGGDVGRQPGAYSRSLFSST